MSSASGIWSPLASKISSSFAATSRSVTRSGMYAPPVDKQNVGVQYSVSPLSQKDLERKFANFNFFELIIVMKAELEVKNHNLRLKNYESTFLGSEAVKWLVAAGHASSTVEAVFIGAELMNQGHIYNPVDEDDPEFKNGYKLYRFAMDDRADSANGFAYMTPSPFLDEERERVSNNSDDDGNDDMDSQVGLRNKQTSGDSLLNDGVERFDLTDLFNTTLPSHDSTNKLNDDKDDSEPKSMSQGKTFFKLPLGNFTSDDLSDVSSPRSTRSLPKTPQAQVQAQAQITGKSEGNDSPLRGVTDMSGPRSIKFSASPRVVSLKNRFSSDSSSLRSMTRESPLASAQITATNPRSSGALNNPVVDLLKAEGSSSAPSDTTSEPMDRNASKANMKIKKIVLKPLEKMKNQVDPSDGRSMSRQSSNSATRITSPRN
eukprot:CAMPEP_0184701868 /NCGR_PEP_ID=MMETSP0313-20130426/21930_1 /TAXON_ID=2792 /ORGANISM="Porphyridium aerugineum, Strain SAG 1380-2" /LENGTH=430 /DNA_ID=CAMNT_0027162113 /DNA_START=155 /DNA_END=1444 /DNA_ORIENTATION=-